MANSLFAAYKAVQLGDAAVSGFSVVNWESDDCRLVLIDTADDDPNVNTDQDLADIAGAARVAVSGALATKTAVLSSNTLTMDAADVTLTAVTGDQSEELLIYRHTGTEATSLLIVSYDTFTSGMPITPNGGDIQIQWNASGMWSW
jgi:hypothetical protein